MQHTWRGACVSLVLCLALACLGRAAWADALTPSLNPLAPPANDAPTSPPAPANPATAPRCTIAAITEDIGTNDAYLGRTVFIAPELPKAGQPALCPAGAAEEAAKRTLAACKQRASNPYNCVYADMDHMFAITTDVVDSSALTAQCPSYSSKFIGIACQPGDGQDVCNIGCGATAAEATAAARSRCEDQHGGDCGITNAVPVQAP